MSNFDKKGLPAHYIMKQWVDSKQAWCIVCFGWVKYLIGYSFGDLDPIFKVHVHKIRLYKWGLVGTLSGNLISDF